MIGTEIAFRLDPGMGEQARVIALRLADLATGAHEHVLFCDVEAGEYGCLAVWRSADAADAYIASSALHAEVEELSARMGRPTRVRRYVMEYQRRGPAAE